MKFLSDILVKAGLTVENTFSALAASNTIYAGTGTRLRTEANNLVFERVSSSGTMKMVFAQGTLSPTAKSYIGYSNATLNLILANEYATGGLELRTSDVIRQQIFSNGNIVIGQASPVDAGYKVDVFGTVRASQLATGAHSFRNETYITPTTDGYTKQNSYNAASAYTMGFVGDLRFGAATAIKAVFSFNGAYSNNGTIYNGDVSLIKIFTSDAFGNPTPSANINGYGINLMPTLNYTQSTSNFTGIYYNPTLTATTGLTHYAMNLVSGLVRVGDLAGTGDRMVVANSSGVLSTQAIVNPSAVLPVGGTAGQILAKIDNTNYNTEWIDNYTGTVKHTVKAGVALTKGQAVYVSSADGTNMIVSKASNATESTSSKTMGIIAQSLSVNGTGFVVTEGLISGLDTSSAQAGDPVWLGTDGNLLFGLSNKPYAPNHLVYIGVVTRAQQNNGEIFVNVQNGFELNEIHNVQITSTPSDNTVLAYEASTSLYKMKSIATLLGYTPYDSSNPAGYISGITSNMVTTALGYTPVTNARTLTINGTTFDLTANRSWSVGTHTGSLTSGYIPKATGTTSLTDGLLYDTGSAVLLGTQTAGSGKFMVYSTTADNHYQAVGAAPSFRFADAITNPTYTGIIGMATASNNFIIGAAAGDMILSNNTNSAGNFLFGTGATERMRINATTGNISINNTNNTYRLDVTGTGRFTGILTLDSQLSFTGSAINYIQATNATGNLTFGVNANNSAFVIRSTGAVQIPTFTSGVVVSDAFGILSISTAYATQSYVTSQGYITSAALAPYAPNSRTLTINGTTFDLSANRSWSIPTHDAVTIGTANGLSLNGQVLSLGLASGSANGALSSTDWTTFNNKQNALTNPVTGTGTTNYLPKFTGSSTIGNSSVYINGNDVYFGYGGNVRIGIDYDYTGTYFYGFATNSNARQTRIICAAPDSNAGISFETGASYSTVTSKMLLTSGGNLGLGTTNPSEQFMVSGTGSRGIGVSTITSGDPYVRLYDNTTIKADIWWDRSTGAMGINSLGAGSKTAINPFGGNVGIGTTSPGEKLTINGGLGFQFNGTQNWHLNTNSSNNLLFTRSGIADRMVITSDGNVGIGTTNPFVLLHLNGTPDGNYGHLTLFDSRTSAINQGGVISFSGYKSGTSAANVWGQIAGRNESGTGTENGYLAFITNTGTTYAERMRITSGGNVGIGTTSPGARLSISANAGADVLEVAGYDVLKWDSGDILTFGGYKSSEWNAVAFATAGSERMRITSVGNVGIGTSSPGYKLQVNGDAAFFSASGSLLSIITQGSEGKGRFYLYDGGNATIGLQTNGASYFNGGNVGIGTTNPDIFGRFYDRILGLNSSSGIAKIEINGSTYSGIDLGQSGTRYAEINATSTDFSLATTTANPMIFYTNSTERLRITSGGNLLVGTSTDGGYRADVSGQIRSFSGTPLVVSMSSNAANDAVVASRWQGGTGMEMRYNPNNALGYIDNTYPATSGQVFGDINFRINSGGTMTSVMTVKANNQSVGIGTGSPLNKLHIDGSNGIRVSDSSNANYRGIVFGATTADATEYSYIKWHPNSGEFRLYANTAGFGGFMSFYSNNSEAMRITSSGNFEIPWANNRVNIMNYDNDYRMGLLYEANARTFNLFSTGGDGGGTIAFRTRGTAATGGSTDYGTERMRITSGGNVIVGNLNYAGQTTDLILTGDKVNANGYYSRLMFTNSNQSGGSSASIRGERITNNYNTELSFYTNGSGSPSDGSEKMRITGAGDVLVNATATTQGAKFYVNGIGAFGQVYAGNLGTGALYSNGGFLTNTNPSDFRLKNTIKPLTYGLNEVLQLNPKTFYYNDDLTKARLKYGFIAQEVKDVMPDLVRRLGEDTDYLGLENEGIFVTLVNAIKEQQVQLNEQRSIINELKSQLNK